MRDIDDADAILLVGSDPLHSSPILDLRIRKAMRRNGAKLVVATDRPTTLDGGAAAVVRYVPGNAGAFLSELVAAAGTPLLTRDIGRGAQQCGEGRRRLGRADRPRGRGSNAALLKVAASSLRQGRPACWKSPSSTNARGLREAGCLPDAGPGFSAASAGKSTEEIREALESGELKTLLLFGADPLRDFPDTAAWQRALAAADHLIVFSTFENASTAMADIVFPLETHAEKDGTVTHPDGRLQRVRPSASRPGDIRPNWGVLAELSLALGHDTGTTSQPSAFAALTEAVPFYEGITDAEIAGRGVRWQDRNAASGFRRTRGTARQAGVRREFLASRPPRPPRVPRDERAGAHPWRCAQVPRNSSRTRAWGPRRPPGYERPRIARPRHVSRSLGGPNHGAEPSLEVLAAAAAG